MNSKNKDHRFTDVAGRVYLRRLTPQDVTDSYIEWFRDTSVTEFLDARDLTRAELENYIVDGEKHRTHYMYGIFDCELDIHIGNLKIGPIQWNHRISDLVCVIGRREFWGQGLAKDAIRIGNRVAFEEFDLRKVTGGIASGNIGSIKAYTGADWVIEGTLRGHHLINGESQDRVIVSCFNPRYFSEAD